MDFLLLNQLLLVEVAFEVENLRGKRVESGCAMAPLLSPHLPRGKADEADHGEDAKME